MKAKLFVALAFIYLIAGVQAVDLNFEWQQKNDEAMYLYTTVLDGNTGIDVNRLEITLDENRLYDLNAMLKTRIGTYRAEIENQLLLQAEQLTVLLEWDNNSMQKTYQLNTVTEPKITATLEQVTPPSELDRATEWLTTTIAVVETNGVAIEITNAIVLGALVAFGLVTAYVIRSS